MECSSSTYLPSVRAEVDNERKSTAMAGYAAAWHLVHVGKDRSLADRTADAFHVSITGTRSFLLLFCFFF